MFSRHPQQTTGDSAAASSTIGSSLTASSSTSHLPSIRSLRSKFQALGARKVPPPGPKVVVANGDGNSSGAAVSDGTAGGGRGGEGGEGGGAAKPNLLGLGTPSSPPLASSMTRAVSAGAIPRSNYSLPPSPASTQSASPSAAAGKSKIPGPRAASTTPVSSYHTHSRFGAPSSSRSLPTSPSGSYQKRMDAPLPAEPSLHSISRIKPPAYPSSPSASTKSGYRISADFVRPDTEPPLAQLRANRTSMLGRPRPASILPGQGLAHLSSPSRSTPSPTAFKEHSRIPSPPTSSLRAFPTAVMIAPRAPTLADHRLSSLDSDTRPFSPSPVPPRPTISLIPSTGVLGSNSNTPSPPLERLKDDMAYRRLSLSPVPSTSAPSPVLTTGDFPAPPGSVMESEAGQRVETTLVREEEEEEALNEDAGGGQNGLGVSYLFPSGKSISPLAVNTDGEVPTTTTESVTPSSDSPSRLPPPTLPPTNGLNGGMSHKASAMSLWNPSPTPSAIESFAAIPLPSSTQPTASQQKSIESLRADSNDSIQHRPSQERLSMGSGGFEVGVGNVRTRQESAGSASTDRSAVLNSGRLSGNTFGDPNGSSAEATNGSSEVASEVDRGQDEESAWLEARILTPRPPLEDEFRSEEMGRSRSAMDSIREGGGRDIATGVVERNSPILVRGGDEHVRSLLRSHSLRNSPDAKLESGVLPVENSTRSPTLQERRRSSRLRKSKSESFDDEDEAGMASPLDDLIAGLGGRHLSAESGQNAGGEKQGSQQQLEDRLFFSSDGTTKQALEPVPPLTISPAPSKDSLRSSLPLPSTSFVSRDTSSLPESASTATAEQMEREIARMEAELLLSGASSRSRAFDPFANSTSTIASISSQRPSSQGSSSTHNSNYHEITPRTARSWSIVEVDQAYARMKEMLGSTRSYGASSPEVVFTPGSEAETTDGERDVERVFERAMAARRAAEAALTGAYNGSPSSGKVNGVVPRQLTTTPPSLSRAFDPQHVVAPALPPTNDPPELLQKASQDFLRPLSLQPLSVQPAQKLASLDSSSCRSSRRHTLNAPVPAEDLQDAFKRFDNSTESLASHPRADSPGVGPEPPSSPPSARKRISRVASRETTSTAAEAKTLNRAQTGESLRSVLTSDDDGGWATPLSSPPAHQRRPRSRLSSSSLVLKSGAGRELGQEFQRKLPSEDRCGTPSTNLSLTPTSLNKHSGTKMVPDKQPSQDSLVGDRGSLDFGSTLRRAGNAAVSDTWFPSTPDRANMRIPVNAGYRLGSRDGDGGSESGTIASIRGMDKLEIFFKYTATKSELERAVMERDALMDALQESRLALSDLRNQRSKLEDDLRNERGATAQLKKLVGSADDMNGDRVEAIVRNRQLWEKRAREAIEDMERMRSQRDDFQRLLLEGREREEELERQYILLDARHRNIRAGSRELA